MAWSPWRVSQAFELGGPPLDVWYLEGCGLSGCTYQLPAGSPQPEPATRILSSQSSLPYAWGIVFKPHPKAKARKRSAVTLFKCLLANRNNPAIFPTHHRELLSVLLWKITLAESSKYKTCFQSEGARGSSGKVKLQHDHVFQQSKMIAKLMKVRGHKVDVILKKAFGCTVTSKEHTRLSKFDKKYDGWARYRKARIKVIDTQTDKRVV